MRCPSCHHDNGADRRFCTRCGTGLAMGCPSCGVPIEAGGNFCGGRGAALTIGGRTTTRSPAPLLAENIHRAKAAVEGGVRSLVWVLTSIPPGGVRLRDGSASVVARPPRALLCVG